MLSSAKSLARKLVLALRKPGGEVGIRLSGHRSYVGGAGEYWERIGRLQFDMLRSNGMQPHHHLYDIACGSLRLGVKAIPYLEPGHYHGLEKEKTLLKAGIEQELGPELFESKRPELVVSSEFEFDKFSQKPDYAIAQSLFTHLTPELIDLCFSRLRPHMKPASLFYATYFGPRPGYTNPTRSHARRVFCYSEQEMLEFGTRHGFRSKYIGEWNHPRAQLLVEYRL